MCEREKRYFVNINNEQYDLIEKIINHNFNIYYSQYDFNKYSASDYKTFQNDFSTLANKNKSIEEALKWKWGHSGKLNYPQTHKDLIQEVKSSWLNFASKKINNPIETYKYWKNALQKDTRYITVAYITHLVHYKEIPIIDQHNYRAMNYFITLVNSNAKIKKKPSNWNDVLKLKEFILTLSIRLNKNTEDIDKYLMMFGRSIKPRKNK